MNVGQVIEAKAFPPVTREQLRLYAEASGDLNPIHLDDAAAKKAGLSGVIAHGMLSAAFLAERAEAFAQETAGFEGLRLKSFRARFRAMTLPGDVISVGGSVRAASPEGITLELHARNQRGEATTTGEAVYRAAAAS